MDKKNVRYTTCVEDSVAKAIDAIAANKGITASEYLRLLAIADIEKEHSAYMRLSAIFQQNQGLSDLLNKPNLRSHDGAHLWSEEE